MRSRAQLSLVTDQPAPEGFRYRAGVLSPAQEQELVGHFAHLPFQAFEFRGFEGKRRVVSYGWRYDFTRQKVDAAEPIPDFLHPIRDIAGTFAGLPPSRLEQCSVIEYSPGAAIGWHRDKPMFGDVVGISLVSAVRFRFRKSTGRGWARTDFVAEPRSAYLLRGPARDEWEHSIPPVETLRYSITLRTMRESRANP